MLDDPVYPMEMELNIEEYSTVTEAYCENVDLAFDHDPTTYATFTTPPSTIGPWSPPATTKQSVPATLQTIPPATSLVGAYQFNEGSGTTSQDASPSNATATITAPYSWNGSGDFGNMLEGSGSAAQPINASDSGLPTGTNVPFTIFTRFKTATVSNPLYQYGLSNSAIYISGAGDPTLNGWYFQSLNQVQDNFVTPTEYAYIWYKAYGDLNAQRISLTYTEPTPGIIFWYWAVEGESTQIANSTTNLDHITPLGGEPPTTGWGGQLTLTYGLTPPGFGIQIDEAGAPVLVVNDTSYGAGTATVADGNWHNVAFVQLGDGSGNWDLYVDGNLQGQINLPITLQQFGIQWLYGFYGYQTNNAYPASFSGAIDALYIFDSALTQAQITALQEDPWLVYSAPAPEPGLDRYVHLNFNTDLWLTRLRYLGNGVYAGFAFDSGWDGNNDESNGIIPLTAYLPLEVEEGVYDLVIDPPLLARGVWYLPDYLDDADNYPVVELNQLQVYIYSEDQINMANPTKNFVTLGCRSLQIIPWAASSSYPFNSGNSNFPLSIQSLDVSKSSKVAEELGGEDIWLNNIYEYERRVTGKFTVQRVSMQLYTYLMNGLLIVDNAGQSTEAQYEAPQYTDTNPYWSLVGFSNEGDGSRTVVLPKCKISGNLSEMWDRTKLTAFDITFEAVWDTTYITTTGRIGAIFEQWYNNSGATTPVYS